MTDQLSEGVLAYLQARTAASPRTDEGAVLALADDGTRAADGGADGAALLAEVKAVVGESLAVTVDWNALSLGDAGRYAAAETGKRHPGLSQEALDAIAWNFTFAWR